MSFEGDRNSLRNTVTVALVLSLVCSIIVSAAAVVLRPIQIANEQRNRQAIILDVAGLLEPDTSIEAQFGRVEARVVDLASGLYTDDFDPRTFDAARASRDPDSSISIPGASDIAGIGRRATHAVVYLVREDGGLRSVILPVYGYGLWSTMYGYVALGRDGSEVVNLRFYQHAETPGLGDQIDDPRWLAQWRGKRIYDASGDVRIEVVRGAAPEGSVHQVDGLAGATLTGRGVMNLMRYWLGEQGFAPYLERLQQGYDSQ